MTKLMYPPTPTNDQTDDYHGTPVADPYRWLEETTAPETQAWIESQNRLTFGFLEKIPARERIRTRLTELWDYPKNSAPYRKGNRYFQLRNTGLQNQSLLYVLDTLDAEPRLLLDPNTLSSDGTVALSAWSVSEDGRWLAYALSEHGSDWVTWHVRAVESAVDLPDTIEWSKFSGAAWAQDSSGFYYSRYDAPAGGDKYLTVNRAQKLYFHRLGQSQSEDTLVYQRPDHDDWGFAASLSEDGRYLILTVWVGTDHRNLLFYKDLQSDSPVVELIDKLEAHYSFVENDGSIFYLQTDLEAERGRLVAIDLANPGWGAWRTLIPEGQDTLEAVYMVGNQFLAVTLHHVHSVVKRYDQAGALLGELALPGLGTVGFTFGSRWDEEIFYAFESFVHPPTIYRYHVAQSQSELFYTTPIHFDFTRYTTRQVFVRSKDGTRLPMFLIHRKDLPQGVAQPTQLYGYGGFGISLKPSFSISRLVWLELGGVLAIANLRGGGEYGEAWHKAGMHENKQNVFDDCIACAEYLVKEKITSPAKLALHGGSNGGLLVGACVNQRPDLFAAAVPAVGVMDMLRFQTFTIGWAWVSEFGSADDPTQFETLFDYSPLHNIRPGTAYPATLVLTGNVDDRVAPGHSFKYAATLQAAQGSDAPILIRIQTNAGHGAGKPTAIQIAEQTDLWAFLVDRLGV